MSTKGNQGDEYILIARSREIGYWYYIHNHIEDFYRPLIGRIGIDLYNLYSRRSMQETEKAVIPRKVICAHLQMRPSSLTEHNHVLTWCGLLHINKGHHRVNGYILLLPKEIDINELEIIKERVYDGTGGRRPRENKTKYPKLRATMLNRLENWMSLQERIDEHTKGAEDDIVKILSVAEAAGQGLLPGFETNGSFDNGGNSAGEQHSDYEEGLIEDIAQIFIAEGSTPVQAAAKASKLLAQYGPEVCNRQLDAFDSRCEQARTSERGLTSPAGLLIKSIENDWTLPKEAEQKKNTWYTDEEFELMKK